MSEVLEAILDWLPSVPAWALYLIVAPAAALENFIPPIPTDMIVVVGGALAGPAGARPALLFLVIWVSNVSGALLVYGLGSRYGPGFFQGRFGGYLLAPTQLDSLARAYRRFGFPIIFLSRFLPVFRPVVPVFAGIARLGFFRTALPLALASGIWYGLLVFLGVLAAANLSTVLDFLAAVGGWLLGLALLLLAALGAWWWRSRSAGGATRHDGEGPRH